MPRRRPTRRPSPRPAAKAADKAKPDEAAKPAKEKPSAPTLKVEKKGSYVYWFTFNDADGAAQTSLPVRFKGKSTDLDLEPLGEKYSGAKLFVMNKTNGNLADLGAIRVGRAPRTSICPQTISTTSAPFACG